MHRERAVPPPPRFASFSLAALAAGSLSATGCVLSSDLSGTSFLCTEEPICPDGLVCIDGRCVAGETPDPDAGGDGTGADGSPPPPPLDFAFRQRLDLANLERGELRDFPLLVALEPDRFDYAAVRPDGADIQFRDADGAVLAHEVEEWNPDGRSIVWVRVPLIDANSTTDFIHLHYGRPDSSVIPDPASVWTRYESVYHLDGQEQIEDSGGRGYDGIPRGSQDVAGFLGRAQSLGGTSEHVDLGTERDFARAAPGVTLEAWVNPQVAQQGVIFGAAVGAGQASRVELRFELGQNLRGGARTQDQVDMIELQAAFTGELLSLDSWTWVALVCDFAAGEVTIYIDDHVAAQQGGLLFADSTPDTPSTQATIGVDEALDSDFFGGLIDEVRLAPVALDADWLSAQHASMTDQLVSYGAAEAL